MKLEQAALDLLEGVEAAIKAGDWKVDGACDPDLAIHRLREALKPTREGKYYYKDNACTAANADSPDCICWHEEALAEQACPNGCDTSNGRCVDCPDYVAKQAEPVAWMVTMENQDGTKKTFPLSGRYKDVCDTCDFGDPIPLYAAPFNCKGKCCE